MLTGAAQRARKGAVKATSSFVHNPHKSRVILGVVAQTHPANLRQKLPDPCARGRKFQRFILSTLLWGGSRRDLGHFQRWPHHKRRLIQPRATCKRYSSQRGRPGKIASLSFTPQPAWSVLQMCSRTPIMSLAELNARAPRRAASRHARALPIAGIFTTLQACTPFPHLPYPKTTKMS